LGGGVLRESADQVVGVGGWQVVGGVGGGRAWRAVGTWV